MEKRKKGKEGMKEGREGGREGGREVGREGDMPFDLIIFQVRRAR